LLGHFRHKPSGKSIPDIAKSIYAIEQALPRLPTNCALELSLDSGDRPCEPIEFCLGVDFGAGVA